MKKSLGLFLVTAILSTPVIGASIEEGKAEVDISSKGYVIKTILIEEITEEIDFGGITGTPGVGGNGLNIGQMEAGSDTDYDTTEYDRTGGVHPAVIEVTAGSDSANDTIINMTYNDKGGSGAADTVTITSDVDNTITITLDLTYSGDKDTIGANTDYKQLTFTAGTATADAYEIIYIHGTVTGTIPEQLDDYSGAIVVTAKYDSDSGWY